MNREDEICAQAINYCSGDKGSDARVRAAFYNGARWADKNPHWISVEDELPPKGQWIITYEPTSPIVVGTDIILTDETADEHHVTHWMPMPQPPRKEVNND